MSVENGTGTALIRIMRSANHQVTETLRPPYFDVSPADEWFAAVDGQTVRCRDFDWHVQVFGIHHFGSRWWFQVGFDGPQQVAGTFEAREERPRELLDALTHWLETTEETSVRTPIVL